jgi:hypothetical protein
MLLKDFACTMVKASLTRFAHVISPGAIACRQAIVQPD